MPDEIIYTSGPRYAAAKRAEQIKRWEESDISKEDLNKKNNYISRIKFPDSTVFLAACSAGDTEEVSRLLKRGADPNTCNCDGLTALHQACIDDNLLMVEFLIKNGANINQGDNEGWTPLHAAASCGFIDIVKFLVENGANIGAINSDGELPIDITETPEIEKYLQTQIDKKGVIVEDARNEELNRMLRDVKQWIRAGQVRDFAHPKTGATALHVASAKGYTSLLKLMLNEAHMNPNIQDFDGWTPLHAGMHWGQREAVRILYTLGFANPQIKDFNSQTAFDVADRSMCSYLEEIIKANPLIVPRTSMATPSYLNNYQPQSFVQKNLQMLNSTVNPKLTSSLKSKMVKSEAKTIEKVDINTNSVNEESGVLRLSSGQKNRLNHQDHESERTTLAESNDITSVGPKQTSIINNSNKKAKLVSTPSTSSSGNDEEESITSNNALSGQNSGTETSTSTSTSNSKCSTENSSLNSDKNATKSAKYGSSNALNLKQATPLIPRKLIANENLTTTKSPSKSNTQKSLLSSNNTEKSDETSGESISEDENGTTTSSSNSSVIQTNTSQENLIDRNKQKSIQVNRPTSLSIKPINSTNVTNNVERLPILTSQTANINSNYNMSNKSTQNSQFILNNKPSSFVSPMQKSIPIESEPITSTYYNTGSNGEKNDTSMTQNYTNNNPVNNSNNFTSYSVINTAKYVNNPPNNYIPNDNFNYTHNSVNDFNFLVYTTAANTSTSNNVVVSVNSNYCNHNAIAMNTENKECETLNNIIKSITNSSAAPPPVLLSPPVYKFNSMKKSPQTAQSLAHLLASDGVLVSGNQSTIPITSAELTKTADVLTGGKYNCHHDEYVCSQSRNYHVEPMDDTSIIIQTTNPKDNNVIIPPPIPYAFTSVRDNPFLKLEKMKQQNELLTNVSNNTITSPPKTLGENSKKPALALYDTLLSPSSTKMYNTGFNMYKPIDPGKFYNGLSPTTPITITTAQESNGAVLNDFITSSEIGLNNNNLQIMANNGSPLENGSNSTLKHNRRQSVDINAMNCINNNNNIVMHESNRQFFTLLQKYQQNCGNTTANNPNPNINTNVNYNQSNNDIRRNTLQTMLGTHMSDENACKQNYLTTPEGENLVAQMKSPSIDSLKSTSTSSTSSSSTSNTPLTDENHTLTNTPGTTKKGNKDQTAISQNPSSSNSSTKDLSNLTSSEAARKARSKRARESRRSTQGVTTEDIKEAERQLNACITNSLSAQNQQMANNINKDITNSNNNTINTKTLKDNPYNPINGSNGGGPIVLSPLIANKLSAFTNLSNNNFSTNSGATAGILTNNNNNTSNNKSNMIARVTPLIKTAMQTFISNNNGNNAPSNPNNSQPQSYNNQLTNASNPAGIATTNVKNIARTVYESNGNTQNYAKMMNGSNNNNSQKLYQKSFTTSLYSNSNGNSNVGIKNNFANSNNVNMNNSDDISTASSNTPTTTYKSTLSSTHNNNKSALINNCLSPPRNASPPHRSESFRGSSNPSNNGIRHIKDYEERKRLLEEQRQKAIEGRKIVTSPQALIKNNGYTNNVEKATNAKPQNMNNNSIGGSRETLRVEKRHLREKRRSTGICNLENGSSSLDTNGNSMRNEEYIQNGTHSTLADNKEQNTDFASTMGDYKKLYEDALIENSKLKSRIRELERELVTFKKSPYESKALTMEVKPTLNNNNQHSTTNNMGRDLQNLHISTNLSSDQNDTSNLKEKKALETRISELEDEIKKMESLKEINQRLKHENGALIRVISKLSK